MADLLGARLHRCHHSIAMVGKRQHERVDCECGTRGKSLVWICDWCGVFWRDWRWVLPAPWIAHLVSLWMSDGCGARHSSEVCIALPHYGTEGSVHFVWQLQHELRDGY